jgi:ribosomal-protein-alanine N-acetyltransferase
MTRIETPRLILRPFRPDDLNGLHAILSDPTTMRFWPTPFTREQSARWLERNIERFAEERCGRMALTLRETEGLIGDCGIMRTEIDGMMENDLGYIVHAAHWGHGYATEAATALSAYGFKALGLTRLCANMPADHLASRRVAEKIGMTLEREFENPRNRGIRTCLYAVEHAPSWSSPANRRHRL